MPTELSKKATEEGSIVISASFTDENGKAMTPKTIVWTLIDPETKSVINNREQVSVPPASSIDILLKADDLAILHDKGEELRELILEITYDGALGSDIPQKDRVRFYVVNLSYVT